MLLTIRRQNSVDKPVYQVCWIILRIEQRFPNSPFLLERFPNSPFLLEILTKNLYSAPVTRTFSPEREYARKLSWRHRTHGVHRLVPKETPSWYNPIFHDTEQVLFEYLFYDNHRGTHQIPRLEDQSWVKKRFPLPQWFQPDLPAHRQVTTIRGKPKKQRSI